MRLFPPIYFCDNCLHDCMQDASPEEQATVRNITKDTIRSISPRGYVNVYRYKYNMWDDAWGWYASPDECYYYGNGMRR